MIAPMYIRITPHGRTWKMALTETIGDNYILRAHVRHQVRPSLAFPAGYQVRRLRPHSAPRLFAEASATFAVPVAVVSEHEDVSCGSIKDEHGTITAEHHGRNAYRRYGGRAMPGRSSGSTWIRHYQPRRSLREAEDRPNRVRTRGCRWSELLQPRTSSKMISTACGQDNKPYREASGQTTNHGKATKKDLASEHPRERRKATALIGIHSSYVQMQDKRASAAYGPQRGESGG